MEEVDRFFESLDRKTVARILYRIDRAEQANDPELFKKIHPEIWEFRIRSTGMQIRLLAFWDKTDDKRTLVVATHGFMKKQRQVPAEEIHRALRLRERYFTNKSS
jgi:phage-related protein